MLLSRSSCTVLVIIPVHAPNLGIHQSQCRYIHRGCENLTPKRLEIISSVVLWTPEPPTGATCCELVKDCCERFGHWHINGDTSNEKNQWSR